MQRSFRSFEKNGCPTLQIWPRERGKVFIFKNDRDHKMNIFAENMQKPFF